MSMTVVSLCFITLTSLFKRHQIDWLESAIARYKSICSIIFNNNWEFWLSCSYCFFSLDANGSILKKLRGCESVCELFCLMYFRTLHWMIEIQSLTHIPMITLKMTTRMKLQLWLLSHEQCQTTRRSWHSVVWNIQCMLFLGRWIWKMSASRAEEYIYYDLQRMILVASSFFYVQ